MRQGSDLVARIHVEKRRGGRSWAPYRVLIGQRAGHRILIGSCGEQLYTDQEFDSHARALEAARVRATRVIRERWGDIGVHWEVMDEGESAPAPG